MSHRHRPLALLLFATLAATAAAHNYWMEPRVVAPATPGAIATATLRLLVGEPFRAEEERPWQPDKTPRFELLHLGGRVDLRPSLTADAQPIGPFPLIGSGMNLLVMDRAPATIELDAAKFAAYLKEEGLESIVAERERLGESSKPGRERYRRSLKALLRVGAAADEVATHAVDQELELVPASDPTQKNAPAELELTARFRKQPLAGLTLHAAREEGAEVRTVLVRTDRDGHATVKLDAAGPWIIAAVHMLRCEEPAIADWESFWTSLTFTVPAKLD